MGPTKDATTNKVIYKHEALDTDGIVSPGEQINNKQTMINKEMPAVTSMNPVEQKDSSQQPIAYTGVGYNGKMIYFMQTYLLNSVANRILLITLILCIY